jgi:hypothetical protein
MPARRLSVLCLTVAAALCAWAAVPAVSQAAPCTPPVTNEIACENTKPGADPETWQIHLAGDDSIQGFATSMSVNKGQTISFKIKAPSTSYTIDILRLGYYGGDGARRVDSGLTPTGPSNAGVACQHQASTGLIDCGNWAVSRSWTVPSTAVSGVYIAHLKRNGGLGESHIPFVVRDDTGNSDIVVQTSDATWQAYNTYGGNSLYTCEPSLCPPGGPSTYKPAYAVSYNRPFNTEADDSGRSALFRGAEYSMIRFLERSGYDVSYISGVDTHRRGNLLQTHKLFISSGHDEYWSQTQRDAMEAARDSGVNLAFFTGNTGFWKTRWAPALDGTQDRTLISYKDTHFPQQADPVEFTGTWRDPRLTTPANGPTPENALTGLSFLVNTGTSTMTVPTEYGKLRLWRNTDAATLGAGQSLQLAPNTLGYEWDVDVDNGFRPAGLFRMSSTTVSGLEVFTDYGSTTKLGGTATHSLTMYKAPSGARVFNSGAVQWAWGLDDWNNDGLNNPPDRDMQQATLNLFADMGVQPYALLPGLFAASPSSDTTKPTSTISSPSGTVQDGAQVTITGTASDVGGRVAGVEVSTDGGATWHPATTGTTSWSYTWIAHGHPSTTIKTRATDDSGNIETPGTGRTINVSCPCSLWGNNVTPSQPDSGDPTPIEVGVKFKPDVFGKITGLRFYKSAANTGTHVGSLWTADGQRLAQATFMSESASGWQTVTFGTPVEVMPNTTYVASYHAPNGRYAVTSEYFYRTPSPGPNGGAMVESPPLRALRNTGLVVDATTNGMYSYSSTSTFPVNSFSAANYWVDVVFSPIPPPGEVTGVSAAAAGTTSATVSWTPPASGGSVTSYKITPYVGSTAQTPKTVNAPATSATVTGLTNGTTYTFKVQAANPSGAGPESAASNSVTPLTPVAPSAPTGVSAEGASQAARVSWTPPSADGDSAITGYTITPYIGSTAQTPVQAGPSATSATVTGLTNGTSYTFKVTATNGIGNGPASAASNAVVPQATIFDFAAPAIPDVGDTSSVELGVKFTAAVDGAVTGIRFYKSVGNTGTHMGSLWTSGGQRITQATFTGETASGWQSVTFSTPVNITAGTTYVASYFAPAGRYSATNGGLSSGADNPPLQAVANSTSVNGVYAYGTSSTFPTNTYNAANYWVDVMFAVPPPGQVSGVSASEAGQTSANVSWTAPASGGPVTSYKVVPYIGSTAQTPKTVAAPATSTKVTGLTTGTTYTFKVQAVNANGTGPLSAASNPVTPQTAVPPSAPTDVLARPASSSALVSWTAPSSDGDSPITGYTITPYVGSTAQTPMQAGASATSATVTGLANGTSYTFKVKARNAVGTGPDSISSSAVTPRNTIFDFAVPAVLDSGDTDAVELGVKFQADIGGTVTGIRFYKAAANTGTHVGSLWSTSGQRITQATFTNESATGWQTVTFAAPVTITANTTYIASYHAPRGHYSVTGSAFAANPIDNPPLHALASSTSSNGVYAYGPAGTFPTNSWNAGNYWVDVLFAPSGAATAPSAPTGVSAQGDSKSAVVHWTAPSSNGGSPITGYTVTPYIGSTAQTPMSVGAAATSARVTGLTNGTSYTFKVKASNAIGSGVESAASGAVTPRASIFELATPAVADGGDTSSVVLGLKFRSDVAGSVTGLRFYKAAGNTGTHVGSLWTADGQRRAQATFSGETASGWQSVNFPTPVAIEANTTYVASYLAPNGRYSVTGAAFSPNPFDNPPLHAIANPISSNGVYAYSSTDVFPTSSWNASNYWVDVLFAPGA